MSDKEKWNNINWENWRDTYDNHTVDERAEVYDLKYKLYPNKVHFHLPSVVEFFYKLRKELKEFKVIEFGGGKGELARYMFRTKIPITQWDNYDISEEAINNSIKHPKYNALHIGVYPWEMTYRLLDSNVCIMSDFIEHIKEEELRKLISKVRRINFFYIKSPIPNKTIGVKHKQAHVLEIGWDDVEKLFKGYKIIKLGKRERMFCRSAGTKDIRTHQSYKYIKDRIVLPAVSIGNGAWSIKHINEKIETLDISGKYHPDFIRDFEDDEGLSFSNVFFDSFNTVICLNVIEHTKHPFKVVKNVYKILKHKGKFIVSVPFKVDLHSRPFDYWRFTLQGLIFLCEEVGFETEHVEWFNNDTRVRGVFIK